MRGKVYRSFFLSYMLVLCLTLAIISLSSIQMLRSVSDDLRERHMNDFQYAVRTMDAELDHCLSLLRGVMRDEKFVALCSASLSNAPRTRQYVMDVRANLNSTTIVNDAIYQIYLLFPGLDLIISNFGTSELHAFHAAYLQDRYPDAQTWLEGHTRRRLNEISGSGDALLEISASYPLYVNAVQASAVMRLDKAVLFKPLTVFAQSQKGTVLVRSDAGEILYAYGDDEQLISLGREAVESGSAAIGGKGVSLSVLSSDIGGITYVSAAWVSSVMERATYLRNVLVATGVIGIALGIALSWQISVRRSKPVINIADMVGMDNEKGLSHLESGIRSILEDRARMSTAIEMHRRQITDEKLRRWVLGTIAQEELTALLMDGEVRLHGEVVYLFVAMGREEHLSAVEEWLLEYVHTRCFFMNDMLVGIVGFHSAEQARALLNHLSASHTEVPRLCIAISRPTTPENMAIAYREAIEILDYQMLLFGEGVADHTDLPKPGMRTAGITLQDQIRLQNAIRTGNGEESRRIFSRIATEYFPKTGVTLPLVKCRMFSLINMMILTLAEFEAADWLSSSSAIDRLLRCKTVRDVLSESGLILDKVCAVVAERIKKSQKSRYCQVDEYICENFRDPDLSVSSIAKHFGMNPSYLSHQFKLWMEDSLLERIHKVRLEHAKRRLLESDDTVAMICEQTGYGSEQLFFRVFKRQEGMTPSQFRRSRRDV